MAENEDVNTLKRRGRRRLVGAIALVLAAVIVLPMVFDSEPKGSAPPVSVRIPGEDESSFTPKVTPKAPAEKPAAQTPVEKKVEKQLEKQSERQAEKPPEKPPVAAEAERARAERALAGGEQFVVQVGAFADPEKVREVTGKVASAKLPYFTERVPVASGMLTRVRVGPFPSRNAAEEAHKKLIELGLKGSKVIGLS
ncbi:MAG: SPOR domain-containing protein [Betaproteobacteria bacterium]|nr:SPOR domain-containing protein [Betaproteobacteria bacterium]